MLLFIVIKTKEHKVYFNESAATSHKTNLKHQHLPLLFDHQRTWQAVHETQRPG
jgi:hypothetical protein